MFEGRCRCGAVRFRLGPTVKWESHGLVAAPQREWLQGSDLLITSSSGAWQLCSHCGTTLFHQSGRICADTIPSLNPEVDGLHQAARKGDADGVRRCIQRGMAVNAKLDYETPWMLAAKGDHEDVCQILLENGARRPRPRQTPLEVVEGQCYCGGVRYRLTPPLRDAEINPTSPETRLSRLWRYFSVPLEQFQVVKGSRLLEGKGSEDATAQGCRRCGQYVLFKSSDNPHRAYIPVRTLEDLSRAIVSGWCEMPPEKSRFGATDLPLDALHDAAQDGDVRQLKKLLARGMPVDAEIQRYTPLGQAASQGNLEACRVLLEHGADATRVKHADYHNLIVLRLLLEHGCNPQTFLAYAVRSGPVRTVRVLLEAGADLNQPDDDEDWTMPLHWSAHNSSAMIRFVIRNGADVTRLSKAGGHALGFCALWGITDKMKTLLACGFPPNLLQADPPDSALHVACRWGYYRCVRLLLRYGADANLGRNQSTPLMVASAHGSLAIVNLLLEHGADPDLKDENGLTALDYARRSLAKFAIRGEDYRLTTNSAGEPAFYSKSSGMSDSAEWTDCHAAIIERLGGLEL